MVFETTNGFYFPLDKSKPFSFEASYFDVDYQGRPSTCRACRRIEGKFPKNNSFVSFIQLLKGKLKRHFYKEENQPFEVKIYELDFNPSVEALLDWHYHPFEMVTWNTYTVTINMEARQSLACNSGSIYSVYFLTASGNIVDIKLKVEIYSRHSDKLIIQSGNELTSLGVLPKHQSVHFDIPCLNRVDFEYNFGERMEMLLSKSYRHSMTSLFGKRFLKKHTPDFSHEVEKVKRSVGRR